LEQIRLQYGAKYILTAHHLDDSIETLMFNFIRGSKIHGLMGIPEQNNSILRPFLKVSKREILKKISEENIPYRLDSTNTDDVYLRNHLRLNIISEFERINPEYRKNLASFMGYMMELGTFIDSQVEIFLR
jgi:tRNA(Ile)-lysidine synthase